MYDGVSVFLNYYYSNLFFCLSFETVLNLKEVNPELWQRIDLLMDHNETMKDDERLVWQKYTVDIIVNSGLRPSWTPEDIFRVIGIIGTNAVNCGMVEGTALFANFSYLSHR